MNNEFKKIILNIAKLPRSDQKWVLNQLAPKQREQFKQLQGDSLLQDAYKFRHLPCPEVPQITKETQLPDACQQLSQKDPLYIAIILEQGQFTWEQLFLQNCMQKNQITGHLHTSVKELKPATKSYVFQQWQANLSFQEQLETTHG